MQGEWGNCLSALTANAKDPVLIPSTLMAHSLGSFKNHMLSPALCWHFTEPQI